MDVWGLKIMFLIVKILQIVKQILKKKKILRITCKSLNQILIILGRVLTTRHHNLVKVEI